MEISRYINFKDKLPFVLFTIGLLSIVGFALQWLGYSIYVYPIDLRFVFVKHFPESIVTIGFLVYLVVFFFLFKAIIKKALVLILHLKNKNYKFKTSDWPSKWIFSGKPELGNSSELIIKSSRAGCLLKNHYWRNFKMTFEMKFVAGFDQKMGIVFRAEDLDNYFMLELSNKGSEKEIKPHVRYHGGWDVVHPNNQTQALEGEGYKKIILELKDDVAYLSINGNLELTWILPTHVDVMYRESESKEKGDPDEKYVQELPFRNKLGRIGFRAHPGQAAIIRGLSVESL